MKISDNKINGNINLDVLKRLNYIYRSTISADKTLDYSKKINQLINLYKSKSISTDVNEPWSEKTTLLITYADNVKNGLYGKTISDFISFYNKFFSSFIDSIHFLPFFPSSGDGGFSVKNHEDIDPAFGTWDEIKTLSKKANVMTDLVLNHASSEGKWFKNFLLNKNPGKDYFFTINNNYDYSNVIRPRDHDLLKKIKILNDTKNLWCTFSYDQIDLDFRNPEVLLEFITLILKLSSYGIKIFRLDAVAFIWKETGTTCLNLPETHEIIKLLRDIVDQLDKNIIIVTETNLPKEENLSYFGKNDEAHWIYNFPLPPLIVHTFLFGNSTSLTKWSMKMPPAQVGNAYLNFIASHDGIGMRPAEGVLSEEEINSMLMRLEKNGSQFSMRKLPSKEEKVYEANISLFNALQYTDEDIEGKFTLERFIASHCIILSIEGVPAFYFNSFFATQNDYKSYLNSKVKRDLNRHKWNYLNLEATLNDENSVENKCYELLKTLISIRKAQPAFHPNATQFTLNLNKNVFSVWRQSRDRRQSIFAITNVTSKNIDLNTNMINLIDDEKWYDLLNPEVSFKDEQNIKFNPYQTIWITNFKEE
ncbi:alpha-amylase family glycosyl hydrolase [Alphaproteobacteria bacterium]|nr:alpha-amylase family glycosyl hydrolase [Alphaproteobacteria bacterium]